MGVQVDRGEATSGGRKLAAPAVVRRRRQPGLVRLHVVEEHEDRPPWRLLVEPGEGAGVHLPRAAERLQAKARHEALHEAYGVGPEPEQDRRRVVVALEALRQAEVAVEIREVRDEGRGAIATIAEHLRERHRLGPERKRDLPAPVDRLPRKPCARQMRTVTPRVLAGEQRGVPGQGPRRRGARLREAERVGGERRQVGGRLARVAVRRQVIRARRVERDEDHVGRPGWRRHAGHHRVLERRACERMRPDGTGEHGRGQLEPGADRTSAHDERQHPVGSHGGERQAGEDQRERERTERSPVALFQGQVRDRDRHCPEHRHVQEGEDPSPVVPAEHRAQRARGRGHRHEQRLGAEARRLVHPQEGVRRGQPECHGGATGTSTDRAHEDPGEGAEPQVAETDGEQVPGRHRAARGPVDGRLDAPPRGARRQTGDDAAYGPARGSREPGHASPPARSAR